MPNKAVSDYMREMQARSAKSRWSGLSAAEKSAAMKALWAKGQGAHEGASPRRNTKRSDASDAFDAAPGSSVRPEITQKPQ